MSEVLGLYNKAIAADDLDIKILYFSKVIEYVSQTVIRINATEAIRRKLHTKNALNPDSRFIWVTTRLTFHK